MEPLVQNLRAHGYSIAENRFRTGRPDRVTFPLTTAAGLPLVGKVSPAGVGDRVFANMVEVWRSSFGERRRPPGLPRPVDYLVEQGILIMERVEGFPLVERQPMEQSALDDAVHLLTSLHDSNATSRQIRSSRRIVRSIRRKAERVSTVAPKFQGAFAAAAEALDAGRVEDLELVPSHGDFSPRNLVLGSNRLVLIDWDRFQAADPARDLAYLGTWCWAWKVRQREPPHWLVLDRAVALYDSLRPQAAVRQRLRFHIAAGLIRIAHSIVELWPAERSVVPRLLQEAQQQLRMVP
ncbi:MAG TPA: phosphotransferase [Vicinamibacterales bacterium]|jgi:aminoglycoside phosphotransferase (APT) family kinase protein